MVFEGKNHAVGRPHSFEQPRAIQKSSVAAAYLRLCGINDTIIKENPVHNTKLQKSSVGHSTCYKIKKKWFFKFSALEYRLTVENLVILY
jgi:hypothetical protein